MGKEDFLELIKFSSREIIEKTGITNKQQLTNTIKRSCDMYGWDVGDFKSDSGKNNRYSFSAFYSELLIIMLKNQIFHPMVNARTPETNVLATDLSNYYSKLIKDIDKLPEPFKNLVYAQSWHMTGDEISNWMTGFVEKLTQFIVNLVVLPDENLGTSLRSFTKDLDGANFNLFQKALIFKHAGIRTFGQPKGENVAMDTGMAELIRTLQTMDTGGISTEDIKPSDDIEGKRLQLYQKIYDSFDCDYYAKSNEACVETLRQNKENWDDFLARISKGQFAVAKGTKQSHQNNNTGNEENVHLPKTPDEQYETVDENPERAERVKQEFIAEYMRYQSGTKQLYKELYDIVDKFVGSAVSVCQKYSDDILLEFLTFDE